MEAVVLDFVFFHRNYKVQSKFSFAYYSKEYYMQSVLFFLFDFLGFVSVIWAKFPFKSNYIEKNNHFSPTNELLFHCF